MNNDRRKRIARAVSLLQGLTEAFDEAKGLIEELKDEEQEAFDNMPEGLQQGERGQQTEQAANYLTEAFDALEELSLDDVISNLENAAE